MAGADGEFNLGEDDAQKDPDKVEEKGGKKKLIIIVVAVLALGGGAGAFFMLGDDQSSTGENSTEADLDQVEEPELDKDPIYLSLDPAFVVSFQINGSLRYLQLKLQIMAYEQEAVDRVSANMPAVRNSLIMLFSGQNYENLSSSEGKEKLRGEVLDAVHEVVRLKDGLKVEEVFFTSFVMQ